MSGKRPGWWWRAPRPRRLRRRRKPRELMPWELRAREARERQAWADFTRKQALKDQERERQEWQERERKRQERLQARGAGGGERMDLHLAQWGRQLEKQQDSLVWKTFLIWGVALVFVVVFYKAEVRAKSRADCLRDAVLFEHYEHYEYAEYGFTLRDRLMLGELCGIPGLDKETRRVLNDEARRWLNKADRQSGRDAP